MRTVLRAEGCYTVEKVNVATGPNGATARVRVVTILDTGKDELLRSVRIYADTGNLLREFQQARQTPRA